MALSMMPWQPVIDGEVIPARPIERIAAGTGAGIDVLVGTNTDEHRLFLVTGGAIDRVTAEVLAGAVAAFRLPVERTGGLSRGPSRRRRPRPARGHSDRPVLAYPRAPPGRRAHGGILRPVYVKECLVIPAVQRAPWCMPCARDRLCLRHPRQSDRAAPGVRPFLRARRLHARRLGGFATNGGCGWQKYDLAHRATMRFDRTSEVVDDPSG